MVYECNFKDSEVIALLLAKNEADGIGNVIDRLYNQGVIEVYVIDGNSKDGTPEIAKSCGAIVVDGDGEGKGSDFIKMQKYFRRNPPRCDAFFMMDADGTYRPEDSPRVVKPIVDDMAEAVIGARMAKPGSMRAVNKFGNSLITLAAKVAYKTNNFTDILSGFWGFDEKVLINLQVSSKEFGLEVNIFNALLRKKYRLMSVPIVYEPRVGYSKLNLLHSYKIPLEFTRTYVTSFLTNSKGKNYGEYPVSSV